LNSKQGRGGGGKRKKQRGSFDEPTKVDKIAAIVGRGPGFFPETRGGNHWHVRSIDCGREGTSLRESFHAEGEQKGGRVKQGSEKAVFLNAKKRGF